MRSTHHQSVREARLAVLNAATTNGFAQTFSHQQHNQDMDNTEDDPIVYLQNAREDQQGQSFHQQQSSLRHQQPFATIPEEESGTELDPCSTLIVEDFIAAQKEWKSVPEIVWLTLKAVKDVLKSQGKIVKDLTKQLAQKASKNEIQTGLSMKANSSEVNKTVSQLTAQIDSSITFDDVQLILRDYSLKSEVAYSLSQKVSDEDVRGLVLAQQAKLQEEGEIGQQLSMMTARMEELQREWTKQQLSSSNFAGQVQKDIEYIVGQIDTKANISDVQEALETKATKLSVSNALHRKANCSDIDVLIEKKVDVSELEAILAQIDTKADLKIAQQLTDLLDMKLAKDEFNDFVKLLSSKLHLTSQSDFNNNEQDVEEQQDSRKRSRVTRSSKNASSQLSSQLAPSTGQSKLKQLEKKQQQIYNRDEVDDDEEDEDEDDDDLNHEYDDNQFNGQQQQQNQQLAAHSEEMEGIRQLLQQLSSETVSLHDRLSKIEEIDPLSMLEILSNIPREFESKLAKIKEETAREIESTKSQIDETTAPLAHLPSQQRRLESTILSLTQQIQALQEQQTAASIEATSSLRSSSQKTAALIQQQVQKIQDDFDEFKENLQQSLVLKAEKQDLQGVREEVEEYIQAQEQTHEVIAAIQNEFQTRFTQFKEDEQTTFHRLETELRELIATKTDFKEFSKAIQNKLSPVQAEQLIQKALSEAEIEPLHMLVKKLCEETEAKTTKAEFNQVIDQVKDTFDRIQKDVLLKANIKDVITILDTKASIKDVNASIMEIHQELDAKSESNQLEKMKQDQMIVNKSLCIENIVGRWIWKSGSLRPGNAVPWETEIINTLQDNFLWEQNKTSILTVSPGLYQISIGFFGVQRPQVQIMVNGEPILICGSESQKSMSGNLMIRENKKYLDSQIVGTSLSEYVTLPARARVSVVYVNGDKGEGFLGLKRL